MQKKKGISLIVLVITIIVMIILAAAIILSLNNAGIIGNANKAVSETDYKNVQTAAQLVYADMMLSETEKPSMMLKQGEYIKQKLIAQGTITTDQAEMYRFKNNGEVIKLQTKAEYEEMYKTELEMLDSTYYTITDGTFALTATGKAAASDGTLEILTIPYGVTEIATYAVFNCTSLLKVIMPDTVIKVNSQAFTESDNIKEVVLSKNIRNVYDNFSSTVWMKNLREANPGELIIINGLLIDDNNIEGEVVIPNEVEVIEYFAFYSNKKITKVIVAETVEEIGVSCFSFAEKLEDIKFLGNMSNIGDAAFHDTSLPVETRNAIFIKNNKAFYHPTEEEV